MVFHTCKPIRVFFKSHKKKKKKTIFHICELITSSFFLINEKKMIFHICEFVSDFFDPQMREKNDIAHLRIHKWFFFSHINKAPKKYCKLAIDFFDSCKSKKKRIILHICKLASDLFFNYICEDKQWYCTFKSQQVVFSTCKGERKKWYCTFVMLQVVSFIHIIKEKIDIAHLGPKRFFKLIQMKRK